MFLAGLAGWDGSSKQPRLHPDLRGTNLDICHVEQRCRTYHAGENNCEPDCRCVPKLIAVLIDQSKQGCRRLKAIFDDWKIWSSQEHGIEWKECPKCISVLTFIVNPWMGIPSLHISILFCFLPGDGLLLSWTPLVYLHSHCLTSNNIIPTKSVDRSPMLPVQSSLFGIFLLKCAHCILLTPLCFFSLAHVLGEWFLLWSKLPICLQYIWVSFQAPSFTFFYFYCTCDWLDFYTNLYAFLVNIIFDFWFIFFQVGMIRKRKQQELMILQLWSTGVQPQPPTFQ